MGTLTHPILTLHTAFSHPILLLPPTNPSSSPNPHTVAVGETTAPFQVLLTTAQIITSPLIVTVKRTLGSASKTDDLVKSSLLRQDLVLNWERAWKAVDVNETQVAEQVFRGMERMLGIWRDSGRELSAEFHEMEGCVNRALTELGGRETARGVISVPKPAVRRGDVPFREERPRLMPVPSWSSASSSTGGSQTSSEQNQHTTEKGQGGYEVNTPQELETYQDHRRESEKFVRDAISRGEPVTLFSTSSRCKSPQILQHSPPDQEIPPLQTPARNAGEWERDVTPTPTDPQGLRHDHPGPLSTPTSSPRKRAALYNSPRWPTTGRPSPVSPDTPSPPATQTRDPPASSGKPQMRGPAEDGEKTSLYARSLYEDLVDEDPAAKIWKGIDKEYSSPSGVGGMMRKRWIRRRQGSLRPSKPESMRSTHSLYAD
jgi:hypothetical protein